MLLSRDGRGEAGRISDTACERSLIWPLESLFGQIIHPARDREGEESQGKDRTARRKTEWKR